MILLFTFGSAVAMGLPVITALFALGVGLGLVTLGTHVFDTAEFAPRLAAMIGLGVGIDYALFILTRFRNGLDEGLAPQAAAARAIDTAGRAVLFAGVTVIISLLGMLLLGVTFLYGVAISAALAVLMTMIAALTLLPALLTIAGRRVDRLRIPGLGKRRPLSQLEQSRWYRWSATIQRHPVPAMLLSALLLMAVFRSILVPLKAMAMNLLSITATFGIVVAVFQWGWLGGVIGLEGTGPIEAFLPVFLFAIVFGLSMDYEVFLMSRIHEEWEASHDEQRAVTRGLALTGRVITAAAAIMVTVFASFMLGPDRIIKLFGPRAWWLPDWLGRMIPRLHVEPAKGDPVPTGEHPVVESA